jgi:hypothetical protein
MVAKGTKRKVAEVDVVTDKCNELARAITGAASLPTDVITMLVEVLPLSLGQPKDKRHRFQEEAIVVVDNVMQGVEESLKKKIEEDRGRLLEAHRQAAPCEAAVAEAEEKLRSDSDRFTQETKALAEAALAFRAARTAVADAKTAQETGDEDLKTAAGKKQKLQAIIDELVTPLKKGNVMEIDVKRRCESLMSELKGLNFDETMMIVLASGLSKAPSVRGDFDHLAIEQLDKYMAKLIDPLDEILNVGEAGRQERAAAVKSAEEALEQSLQAQKLRADAFEAAWAAKKEDESRLVACKTANKDLAAQTKFCEKTLYNAEAEFECFQEFARKTFEELKARETPEPAELEKPPDAVVDAAMDTTLETTVILPEAITA